MQAFYIIMLLLLIVSTIVLFQKIDYLDRSRATKSGLQQSVANLQDTIDKVEKATEVSLKKLEEENATKEALNNVDNSTAEEIALLLNKVESLSCSIDNLTEQLDVLAGRSRKK